jgi:hypothetical protein
MSDELARTLMDQFALATGLIGNVPPVRYLWTDAFAVQNLLALHRTTGDARYLERAEQLVQQVHHLLGKHRADNSRHGWISGLSEEEGTRQPTRGGLRIGKPLAEREPHEPYDPRLEWERDGQYYHYLTKWMQALCTMHSAFPQRPYGEWAIELMVVAQRAFTVFPPAGSRPRMVWKQSIDLTRPLVSSMGQHDPLDGLVTCLTLSSSISTTAAQDEQLRHSAHQLAEILHGLQLPTDDTLGIGGLLDDASRLAVVVARATAHAVLGVDAARLLKHVLHAALTSLQMMDVETVFMPPASQRLAFRELGLAIGLNKLSHIDPSTTLDNAAWRMIRQLAEYRSLASSITSFWSQKTHRENQTWKSHANINDVMLASSLLTAEDVSAVAKPS